MALQSETVFSLSGVAAANLDSKNCRLGMVYTGEYVLCGCVYHSRLQVLLPCWATNPTAVVLELYMQPYAASRSRALQPAVCFARMELPLSKLAAQQSGKPGLVRDLQLTVLQAAARSASSTTCNVTLEVVQWEVAAYLGHLQQLAAAAQAAAKAAAAQAAAAASSSLSECDVI
jgi:hypothetical protein